MDENDQSSQVSSGQPENNQETTHSAPHKPSLPAKKLVVILVVFGVAVLMAGIGIRLAQKDEGQNTSNSNVMPTKKAGFENTKGIVPDTTVNVNRPLIFS